MTTEVPAQGDVWRYATKNIRGERLIVIVSGAAINADERRPWLIGIDLIPDNPDDPLTVPLGRLGWADAASVVRVLRRWLVERVAHLDTDALKRIDAALRTALDL